MVIEANIPHKTKKKIMKLIQKSTVVLREHRLLCGPAGLLEKLMCQEARMAFI